MCLVALLALSACGGGGGNSDGAATLARAEDGLRHLDSTPVHVTFKVQTPVPVDRSLSLGADRLPKLDLTRWAKNPKRISCAQGLDCARADVDVEAVLRGLESTLSSVPVAPKDVRNAQVDVAVERNGRLRYLHLHGNVHVALLGDVPFEADLDVEP